MNYYPFHIGDYRSATQHLNPLEHYIYRELIDWYYLDERPIPLETQVVMRRLRLGSESDMAGLRSVLTEFFLESEKGWIHTRIEAELQAYKNRKETAKANGKLGGRPKKTKLVILANPELTQQEPNRKLTNNQEPIIKTPPIPHGGRDCFGEFWALWPSNKRKGSKAKCAAKWSAKKLDSVADDILAHVRSWLPEWTRKPDYCPAPLTYLNESRWDGAELNGCNEQPWYMSRVAQ